MQVSKQVEGTQFFHPFAKYMLFCLLGIQVIPAMVFGNTRLCPDDFAKVITVILAVSTTKDDFPVFIFHLKGKIGTKVNVVQPQLSDQVSLGDSNAIDLRIFQAITGIFLFGFVLLIITISCGGKQGSIETPFAVEFFVVKKLVMRLGIVVRFIVVWVSSFVRTSTVESPIASQLFFCNTIPGLIGFFLSGKYIQAQR